MVATMTRSIIISMETTIILRSIQAMDLLLRLMGHTSLSLLLRMALASVPSRLGRKLLLRMASRQTCSRRSVARNRRIRKKEAYTLHNES